MVDQLETVFDARAAVGDLGEIVYAELLLIFEAEGAVVSGDNLQMIVAETLPEFIEVFLLAQRWREDVLGSFEIGAGEFVDGEQEVLRTRLGESGHAAVASLANLIEGVFG